MSELQDELRRWLNDEIDKIPMRPQPCDDSIVDDLAERLERLLRRVEALAFDDGIDTQSQRFEWPEQRILAALKDENDGD